MVRIKLTHDQGERMEVTREFEGKEVRRRREDVSIGDGKTLKQERNKVMSWNVKRDLSLEKVEYYSKRSNA